MTIGQLKTKKPANVTIAEAASIMGVTPRFLHLGLQHERFPFGTAVQFEKRWSYYINTERFIKYMEGGDMGETNKTAGGS